MTNIEFGTVVYLSLYTLVDVCFSCLVLCVVLFVRCLLRALFVVYVMLYSSFLILLAFFVCGFVVMG